MIASPGPAAELRAHVKLTKREIAHLWNGGILSLKVEGPAMERTWNSAARRWSRSEQRASSSRG